MLLPVLRTCPTSLSPSAGRRGDVHVLRLSQMFRRLPGPTRDLFPRQGHSLPLRPVRLLRL